MPAVAVNEHAGPQNLAQLLGVTQTALAAVLGCHKSTVGRKMRGELAWKLDELYTISEHYGVPVGQLLDGTADPTGGAKQT
jgi:hypothetical protein